MVLSVQWFLDERLLEDVATNYNAVIVFLHVMLFIFVEHVRFYFLNLRLLASTFAKAIGLQIC